MLLFGVPSKPNLVLPIFMLSAVSPNPDKVIEEKTTDNKEWVGWGAGGSSFRKEKTGGFLNGAF